MLLYNYSEGGISSMKFIKYLLIVIIVLAGIGYGVYYFGIKFASDRAIDVLSTELENSGEIENIKKSIKADPELGAFMEDAESIDENRLPFTTKEEATKLVIKRVGVSRLQEIQSNINAGQMNKEDILEEIKSNFTEEEIEALKLIAYKELYK